MYIHICVVMVYIYIYIHMYMVSSLSLYIDIYIYYAYRTQTDTETDTVAMPPGTSLLALERLKPMVSQLGETPSQKWILISSSSTNLVGGLEHGWMIFHFIFLGCHPKPIDELIFFRGVETTNQIIINHH